MNVSRDPCTPGIDDVVIVTAEIVDNSTISEASVYYRLDGGAWNIVQMSATGDGVWSGGIFSSGTEGVFLEYFVKAADDGVDKSEVSI
jgi:hypothetical protein